jgi:hypothetical protein
MPEEQLQDNPIFKFMKSNNLTKLDEKSFLDKYSTPEKAKEIHGFMLANKLTDLDETKFYDKYLSSGLKKKEQEVSQYVSSPTPSQSVSPDLEKGKAFAEKGFLMKGEGTKEQKRISLEPSLFGGAPNIKVLQEGEEPSALSDISGAVAKGLLQGKVANILSAGKRPTEDELGEIAQLQSDAQLFPQSKSEKVYQEKGLKGLFKENPLLGAQFVAETMASSLSSLIEASKKTVPAAVIAGAGVGAPTGVGAMVGAGYGLLAGQSAAGYNLSTSQDILNSLSENGVDVSDKASLIKAFSDENKMAKIRNTAAKYGVPILIFDAATAGLAGKLGAGAIGKSLSKKLLAGLGETGIQIAGGMGGELSGQLASGKKVNWDDIVMEGLAEVPGGISEVATGIAIERSKSSSNNKTLATQIATQGVQNGTEDAIVNLNRDLSNNVITPKQYQEGLSFVEKAFQVYDKIPETVTGENRVKSIELLVERNDIKQANENLIQQKQASDEAYHAGIDEEIKANEERIKKIDSEVYDITKKPEKGTKKYTVDGKEVSQEEFDALQDKPIGTKTLAEPTEIGGLKVIKRAQDAPNGEAVYEVEGERFLTADGKELKVAKVELPKEEVKPTEVKKEVKTELEQADMIPATYKTINIDEEIAKNNEIIKKGSPLDKSFARMANKDLLRAKSLGKKEYQSTEKPPKGYNLTTIDNKEYYTKQKEFKPKVKEEFKPTEVKDGFDYVRNKFIEDISGGKRLSDKESNILNKEVDKLIERAEKENGVKRNELKQSTWETNDGYTVTEFFENGRGGTRITTPKGEEINIFDNKYKGESGKDISYFPKAAEVKPIEVKETIKIKENAIQKPSTREVLQRAQEGVRETGGERKRVEPSVKGEAVTKEGKQVKVNEEKVLSSKGLKSAETRKINEEANKIEATDVRSAALKYLANAKLSWSAIDEVAGRVERAKLNTGERELKSAEARSRDYVAKKGEGESLDKAAHDIWESLSENIPDLDTRDVKNALMDAIREHSSKSEAAKALIEGYKEVDIDEQLNKYYERLAEDNPEAMDAEMAKLEESMSNLEEDDNYEFDYPEEHINNLKSQYEKESETKAEQPTKGSERKGDEKVSGRKGGENVKAEEGLAKEFKEATAKASKKAKENAKKEFVERNFDNIVEKLKIQIKCPT